MFQKEGMQAKPEDSQAEDRKAPEGRIKDDAVPDGVEGKEVDRIVLEGRNEGKKHHPTKAAVRRVRGGEGNEEET